MLTFALALAFALASAAPSGAQDLPIDKRELKAFEALEKAMKAASKGQYDRAVSLYRKIAKLWPRTTAGVTARARSEKIAYLGSATLVRNGPSSNRLDIAIMGDGYRLGDQNDFDDQAKVIPKLFKKHKLYGEYYSYLNFHRINLRSKDQGVTGFGRTKETALGGYVSGTIQGHVAVVRSKVMNYLSQLKEQDGFTFVIVKAGSYGTGGRGIATIGGRADETAIHEWGHAFADLGDEYTGSTGHRGGGGRWANSRARKDP